MKTLQIGDLWLLEQEGGLARYYYELLRHLPRTDTSSVGLVVGSDRIGTSSKGLVSSFARPCDTLLRRMVNLREAATAQIRRGHFDVIASHFAPYGLPLLDKVRATPMVVHFHGPWGAESVAEGSGARAKSAIERVVYSCARRLIVLSRCFQRELMERYGVPEERIRIIPGGIDTERFNTGMTRTEARQLLGWPGDRPILLTVRRQVRRMGLEELIESAVVLAQRCPEMLLLLGGAGPLAAELQTRIRERGLERNVQLLGRIDDQLLPLAYRAADITVVPSRALEGFGLITLESLAAGTPVYVTPVGGLPEIMTPFAPDCIFKDLSAGEMAHVLSEALLGARQRPTDEACRRYAVDNFSWNNIAERVRGVYDEAVAA